MTLLQLIKYLEDGEYHSGSEMGDLFGVSRTAVWKLLSQADSYGIALEKTKGKGYRIPGGLELLDQVFVARHLTTHGISDFSLEILPQIGSTNTYLMDLDTKFVKRFTVCLAEQQTEGRGRRGRTWHSPFAKNSYISIAFQLDGGSSVLDGLSLVVGIGVIRALLGLGIEDARIKWPNDIWIKSKKLAGILVELKGEPFNSWKVVAGIGVNIKMDSALQSDIDQPWVSMCDLLTVTRNQTTAKILECVLGVIEEFGETGLAGFMDEWNQYDYLQGRRVYVPDTNISGVASGINESGALIVNDNGRMHSLNAGEVSVRSSCD
jgi:BirA family biotin operon repressor/biotin-[acetyl-CoA-carboxylase] ligase